MATSGASFFVPLGDLRLHCLSWSGGSSHVPFVLIHGLASNARFWELTAEELAAAGHPVYAPDLRGHGSSDKPEGGYDFDTVSGDLHRLIRSLGLDRWILAGHSWGGMVALDFAGRYPPSGLVVVDGGISQVNDYPGASWEKTEKALTPPRLAGIRRADFVERVQSTRPDGPLDERRLEIVLANFESAADGTIAPHLTFERHLRVVRAIWEYPTYAAFDRLRTPVLMIAVRPRRLDRPQDKVYLELKRRGEAQARERVSDLEFIWLEEADHDVPLHQPQWLAEQLLRFARRAVVDG